MKNKIKIINTISKYNEYYNTEFTYNAMIKYNVTFENSNAILNLSKLKELKENFINNNSNENIPKNKSITLKKINICINSLNEIIEYYKYIRKYNNIKSTEKIYNIIDYIQTYIQHNIQLYETTKKTWEDIFNNDTLIYDNFNTYYEKSLIPYIKTLSYIKNI